MILKTTPEEKYCINKRTILVKREDLCGTKESPTFSKIRGLIPHLEQLKKQGYEYIAYTETSISMAGWGVAWACNLLGLKSIIFDPQYKNEPELLKYHRKQWKINKAIIIPIPAGMAKVNWYVSKNYLKDNYKKAILLPLGIPLKETIEETAKIAINFGQNYHNINNIVVNIGSGTITAGIWKGLSKINYSCIIWGIMGRTGNINNKYQIIEQKSGLFRNGILSSETVLNIIDPGWEYTDRSNINCPFECHPYYDLKAWEWLVKNLDKLNGNIAFWNIGH